MINNLQVYQTGTTDCQWRRLLSEIALASDLSLIFYHARNSFVPLPSSASSFSSPLSVGSFERKRPSHGFGAIALNWKSEANEEEKGCYLAEECYTDSSKVVCVKFCKKESGMLRNVGKLFGRHRESAYVAGRRCRCEQLPGKVHAAWLLRLIVSLRCSFKVSMLR